jgi:RHS repeat-associated protein
MIDYYLNAHLGSARAMTSFGWSANYYPLGEIASQTGSHEETPFDFTGQERDRGTGLMYFGARYYDPGIGRWLSVDPILSKNPSVSPYVFCRNNPINRFDPDGRMDHLAFSKSLFQFILSWYALGLGFSGMVTSGTAEVVTVGGSSMGALPAFFLSYATFVSGGIGIADAGVNMVFAYKTPNGMQAEEFKGIVKTVVEGFKGGKTAQEIAQLLVHLYGFKGILQIINTGNFIDIIKLLYNSSLTSEDIINLLLEIEKISEQQAQKQKNSNNQSEADDIDQEKEEKNKSSKLENAIQWEKYDPAKR